MVTVSRPAPRTGDDAADAAPTTADVLLRTLLDCGSRHLFVNLGTDHTPLIEAVARCDELGRARCRVILCPHESVAVSMAHGYAQATGLAQTVLVHVDVGTQNMGGALHNIARTRVPALILAGLAPVTEAADQPGSRDMFVHYLQDLSDQAGIVRPYVKWEYELRRGATVEDVLRRAFRVAGASPSGPVYLSVAREVLEERLEGAALGHAASLPADAATVPDEATLDRIALWLREAEAPVAVTSYAGRRPEAVGELVALAEALAMPVMEAAPHCYMNFPTDHPLFAGPRDRELLGTADLVLLLDCDVPWIPSQEGPRPDARIVHLDIDPLKPQLPLWSFRIDLAAPVELAATLPELRRHVGTLAGERVAARRAAMEATIAKRRRQWEDEATEPGSAEAISADWLTARLSERIPQEAIVVEELVSNAHKAARHLTRTRPGTLFASGGSSIGWGLGAAAGVKLAHPDREVVCLLGDGAFLFAPPAAALWVARQYGTPYLAVVYNNRGWGSPEKATRMQHPDGHAARRGEFAASFGEGLDLAQLARAAGCHGERVARPDELEGALARARRAVRDGRPSVVDVLITRVSGTCPT